MLPQKKDKKAERHLAAVPDQQPFEETLKQTMELDRMIHERLRLGIVSALAVNQSLSFSDLKMILKTSDGNLSVHARKLEGAGYIQCNKSFEGRVPHTEYQITQSGREALEHYLHHMESLIESTRQVKS